MACTIVRNKETGKIDHVKAPNGERSRLFESIRIAQPNWSDNQLLREYAKYYTTEFQDKIKEAKRLDSSFDLDLDEKLRNVLINLYPEIELAYTNDIIQPADINSVFNQLEEQYKEVKTETTNRLNDLLSEVPDDPNSLNETIISTVDEKLIELLRSQNPNANLTHLANNLVAINTPAYRNYEYNKRLYQIQEYKKQLTNRNDVKGLEILSELEKLLTQNKNSFSQNLVDFLNYDTRKALTGNTYNVATGIALEFVMGSLPAGLVLTTLAFAAPTLSPFFIIGAAMSTWGGYTLSKIAYNITKGFSKRKKATDIIKRADYITELLNLDVLNTLEESLTQAQSSLFHNIWMSDLDKLANTVNEKGENVFSTDEYNVRQEVLRLGKIYSTEKLLADKQIYRDYYNINEQLKIIRSLVRKLEKNPVFLKEIEIDHRFKALVEEIYTLSDEKINNIEQLTAQNIAENVLVAINPDGSNIQNSDLKRIFIRSGLARNYNDRFSQNLFKEDIVNILMAEEIKIKGNTSAYKMDVLYALGQSLEGLDFKTDDLLRKYLADSVEDATNSLDYFSDYQIANTSFGEIFDKINNSDDFRQREFYKSVYRQKNEALFNDKSNFNIFQFIKSKFYKTLLNQSGYDSSNIQFQRLENKILGQANIKAMTVLINAVDQKQDTLPHEYAHHYIAWYRHTPIVQEAIAKWGSEEALVQAIGEQAVKQEGEAWTWWKNFVEWILNKFAKLSDIDKETLKNALTDAFLTRTDLDTIPGSPNAGKVYLYRLQEKDFDINTNTIQRAEQLISEGKAKWWHEQIAKNPERRAEMEARDENYGQWFTDAVEKLDYYLEDKEGELEILRITVDKKDLDKYNVGKSGSPNAKRFSNRHHDEFIVPKEIIEKAERFNVSDIPALILDRIPTNNEKITFDQTFMPSDEEVSRKLSEINLQHTLGNVKDFDGYPIYDYMATIVQNGLVNLTSNQWGHGATRIPDGKEGLERLENILSKKDVFTGDFGPIAFSELSETNKYPSTWEASSKFIITRNDNNFYDKDGSLNTDGIEIILNRSFEPYGKYLANKYPNIAFKNAFGDIINFTPQNERTIFNQTTEKQGELQADKKRLIDLLGGNMYKGNIVDVSIKELLQNSFDAVKIAKSQGLIDNGQIDIIINEKDRTITFEDNGTGMTSDVVEKAFFTIGGTYKGDNIDNKLKSGGLGLAKMAFIFGSDEIILETVKDGVKTRVQALSEDIRNDNFKIVTSSTKEKNGTKVTVKIPKSYVDNSGNTKIIYFPTSVNSINLSSNILSKPVIGDVNVDLTFVDDKDRVTQQKISEGKVPEEYDLFTKATTSFADIDIYVNFTNLKDNIEKHASTQHIILSSGLYQFDQWFTDGNNNKIPFDIIVNIKPKVSPTEQNYPFNNQREDFRPTVKEDISALEYYIKTIWASIKKEIYNDSFSNILNVETVDLNFVDEKSVKENARALNRILKQDSAESSMKSKALVFLKKFTEDEPDLKIENGNIKTKKRVITKEEQKEYGKTFRAERKITFEKSDISKSLDVNQPVIHNNTKMVFNEAESEYLIKFANIMLNYKKQIIQHYGNDYSPNIENQFWGVSIDKSYYGVNVKETILPLVSVNPFSVFPKDDIRGKTNRDLANYIAIALDHLIIHELNHNFESGEGSSFTFKFLSTYADVHSLPNYFSLIGSLKKLVFDNLEIIKKLNNEYQLTENLRISLKADNFGNLDEGRADKRAEAISADNSQNNDRPNTNDYGSNNEFGENLEYKLNKTSNNEFYQLDEDQKTDFIEGLDNYLISFLEQFGVAVKDINEFKNRRGVNALGVTDTLNKIVYYSQNRNKYTLPEEAAHMLLFLAGLNNNVINKFIRDIQFWNGYDAVHKKYVKVYGQDIAKIKLEAAGQLLSQILVEEYNASGISDRIIQGVKNAVNSILDMFKNIFKVPKTADDMSGYSYNLGRKIARKILEGDVEYITKLPDNLKKLKYDNVVKPNTFVKDVIDDFTSLDPNIKISGSLALSLQGDVYRESDVTVHDLDFVVVGDDAETKLLNHLKNKYSTITINQFDNDSYRVNQFFVTKKENTLIPASGSDIDNMEFEGLRLADGSMVNVDNDNTLVIDIFVHPETDSTLINDKSYDSWEHIFISKQNLGSLFGKTFTGFRREKDQRDFNYFDTPKDVRYQNEDNLFYQLDDDGHVGNFQLFEEVDKLCPNGICNYTAKKSTEYLESIGLNPYPTNYNGSSLYVSVKSPLGDFNVIHYISAVAINDNIYIYDMPQHEFISNEFFGRESDVKLKETYKPRLIPLTLEDIESNYNLSTKEAGHFIKTLLDNRGQNVGYSGEIPPFTKYIETNIKDSVEYISILKDQIEKSGYKEYNNRTYNYPEYLKRLKEVKNSLLNKKLTTEEEDKVIRYFENKLKLRTRDYIPSKTNKFDIIKLLDSIIGMPNYFRRALPNINSQSLNDVLNDVKRYISSEEFITDVIEVKEKLELDLNSTNKLYDEVYRVSRIMEDFAKLVKTYGIEEALDRYDSRLQYEIRVLLPSNILEKYHSKEQASLMLARYWGNKDNIVKQISSGGYKNYKTLVNKRLKEHSKFNKINTLLNYLVSVEYDTDYLYNIIGNEARRRYNYFNKIDRPHFRLDENNEPIYTPNQTNTESIPEILHEIKYQHSFYHLANLGAELSNINNIPNIETYEEELLGGYSSRYDHNDKVIYTKKDLNKFDKYISYLKSYFEASATNTLIGMPSIHQEMLNNILDNAYDRLKEKGADQIPGFNKAKLLNSVFNNSYLIGLLKKTPAINEYRDLVSPNVENPSLYMQLIKVIANVNGVSNNNLPVLDQILSTRADLVKENDNLAAKPDLYFNLQDQYDSPESARLGYNELMQMVIASELEDNVDLNESNYPTGTKNEAIQQIGHTEEQKQAFEKIKKESDKIKRTEVVTIEQLEQAAKGTNKKTTEKVRLLKKFVDSTARYVIVDEEGVEKIIPLRPSDLGKLVFAEKRNFNKEDITRMDSSRDSILSRGMGTTMHKVQQLLINEIDKQNEDNSILSFQTLGDVKDFYNNNYLKVINNTTDPELKEIVDSINKKGTYSKEYSSEELLGIVDVNVPKEDRTFTFDKTDFENLAYLAFKLYHQVYKIQFDLDANSNIKHKPIILTETKVVDEDNGIAGAIDLLVVYTTDKELKYGFYDYKFINFEREMDILQTKPDEETIKKQKITTQYRNKTGKIIELDPSALKSKDYNPYLVANKLRAKYQSFDLQITAYKDILTKGRYGILKSQIMESRVIPVNMMFKKVKDGETYKRIPTIKFLDHDHELLSQIPFANELTNDTKINEFIELLFTKRAELYKLRERKRDDERINDRITDLDYIIKTLQVKKDIKAVAQRLIQIGDAIEGAIANGKESDSVFGKMYATDEDLVFYEEMIKLYDNFSSYVTYEYDKLRKEAENSKDPNKEKTFKQIDDALAEQNFKIKSLLDKIRTVRDERLLSYADSDRVAKIQDNFDVELNINSKDLRNMGIGSTAKQYLYSDISWIQATLYGISDWDNPLAFMGKQILDNINYEVKEYTESVGKRIEEHRNALVEYAKRKGISPMAVFELFINRIGNKALFVSKLDSEFYKERAKAIDEKDLKWLKQNLVFDKEKFDKAYKKYEDRLLTKYHLKDLSGKDTITNNVKYQLKAFESKFNAEKSEFAYYTDRNYFLKANPQAEIKYESNKWKTIKANKELLDFYNFYLEMIDEIKDLTGDTRINSLFIPQIHRDTADILSNNFFSFDAIKNVYTSFVESNKLRTEDEAIGLVINDQVMDDVPLRYADPINIDNLLTDLTKSLMLMSYSAKTYQMAELAKGTLEAIRMAIADTKFTERDTLGNKKQGKLVEGSVSKLYEAYSKQLKYHLYGQTLQSTKLSRMSGIGTGTLGRVNPIKVLRDVMSFYSKKSLAFNMTSIVGGHFNVKSQLRQLAKKEQHFNLKTLNETEKIFGSINREAHIFNEMFKISQEGNAGLIFEQANRLSVSKLRQVWNKPISYFFQRRSDDAMDAHLLYTMLKSYALHPDGKTVFPISKKNKFLKGTEWENAEIKSMWDSLVFDENATDPNAKITIKSFDGSTEMTKLQFMTFRERTRKLMSRARGNVSNEDIANYRNTLEGQVLGQFKGWVPTTLLLERFGQARYNFTLDELEIGRYRVFLGEFTKEGIMPKLGTFAKMMSAVIFFKSKNLADVEISKGYYNRWRLENPELADKVTFEEFVKTRSSQLAAFAAEIRMYLLIKLALLGIGFAAGDKEEKRNPAIRTLMTWLDRVALEIGFYFDPSQTVQIVTRGPLPLLNMVNELRNLLGNSVQEIGDFIAGAEKDKKISFLTPGDEPFTINIFEEKPDRTPPFTYIFRFVPGLKGISDLLELTKDPDERPTLLEWAFGVENYKYR